MSDSGSAPAAPDYSQLAAASDHAADVAKQLGDEQLAQNQQQYNNNMAVAQPIINAQTGIMNQQIAQSNDYYNYLKQYSRPDETALFYQAMGLTPDEINQVETLRSQETQAGQDKAAAAAAAQPTSTSISVPTQTLKQNLPDGAVKGSDIGASKVLTGYQNGQTVFGNTIQQPTYATVDANSYYVKNADGTYKQVNPTYDTVNGTQQVQVNLPASAPQSAGIDTPQTDALIQQLAAGAQTRAENEGADTAIADSRNGFTNATNTAIRQGLRYGFSPDKFATAAATAATGQAQQAASAANAARTNADNKLFNEKLSVDSLYRNLPAESQSSAQTAVSAGNSAVGNETSPSQIYLQGLNSGNSTILAGTGQQITGLGNVLNAQTSYANSFNANNNNTGLDGALGSIAGSAILKWSDENVKKDISPTSDEESLAAVEKTPVKSWKYDSSKVAGQDDATHIGPMAQDVQQNMGESAAPGGRMVDLISMNGITMNAVKALSKKVDALDKRMSAGRSAR